MLKSMTGFGAIEVSSKWGKIALEIQTINRRHLEVHMQLPKEFAGFELDMRKQVSEVIHRGLVSFRMRVQWDEKKHLPNLSQLQKLKQGWENVASSLQITTEIDLPFLVERMKELGSFWEVEDKKALQVFLEDLTKKALQKTLLMRRKEGEFLQKDIEKRVKNITTLLQKIEKLAPKAMEEDKKRLQEKIVAFLPESPSFETQLIREVASFSEKSDVTEEIVRFFSHIKQFTVSLKEKKDPIGRKLDFLVQEMMREANTICAKASSASIISYSVEIKADLERIKEQIQNVE